MELTKNIFNFVMLAGVIQGFVFLIYTTFSKRGRDKTMIYLNLLVLFLTLNNIQIPVIDIFFKNANYFIHALYIPFYLVTLPAFYAFMVHYLKIENKISNFFSFSLALFFLECAVRLVFYFFYFNKHESLVIAHYAQAEEIFNATFCLFLFTKATFLVFNRGNLYSYVLSFDKIKWLKTFVVLAALVLLFWIIAIVLNLKNVVNPKIYIYYPLRLSSSILLYWIGYQGFRRYTMLEERIEIRHQFLQMPSIQYEHLIKPDQAILEKLAEINAFVIKTECYLNADLTIKKLAHDLSISESNLSRIVKLGAGANFSDFINKYRVEKSKWFLKQKKYDTYTTEVIGMECGFNSNSTFYAAFKKFNDLTPAEFRNS